MRNEWGSGSGGRNFFPNALSTIPVTKALLAATVAAFLAFFFFGQSGGSVVESIALIVDPHTHSWLFRPWTLLTHEFLETHPLWILFGLYWLYSIGGMLERSWGFRNYVVIFFALSAVAGLAVILGAYILQHTAVLAGLYVVLAALTVAWAALDPYLEVSFWGVPMQARRLSLLTTLLVYFYYGLGFHDPILALFVLAAPGAAWIYVRKLPRLNLGFRAPRPARQTRRQPLLREDTPDSRERVPRARSRREEKEEIERLKKLLGEDDDRRR